MSPLVRAQLKSLVAEVIREELAPVLALLAREACAEDPVKAVGDDSSPCGVGTAASLPPIPPRVAGTRWTAAYIAERNRILALHRAAGVAGARP